MNWIGEETRLVLLLCNLNTHDRSQSITVTGSSWIDLVVSVLYLAPIQFLIPFYKTLVMPYISKMTTRIKLLFYVLSA